MMAQHKEDKDPEPLVLSKGALDMALSTSGVEEETGRHVVWGYNRETGAHFTIPYQFIQVHFPGTGDMFSAVLVGELLAGRRGWRGRLWSALARQGEERRQAGDCVLDRDWLKKARDARTL